MPLNPEQFTACHRRWADMMPTEGGRLCSECNKEIVDFRNESADVIEAFHAARPGVCGLYSITQFRTAPRLAAATIAASLAVTGLPTAAQAQVYTTAPDFTQPESTRAVTLVVRGIVIDSTSRRPLPGTQVHVGSTRFGAITDAKGEFAITVTSALSAPVFVSAHRIGYKTLTFETPVTEGEVTFEFRMAEVQYEVVGIVVTGTRAAPQPPAAAETTSPRKPSLLRRLWNWITG